MKLSIAEIRLPSKGTVVLTVSKKANLGQQAKELDRLADGALTRAIKARQFEGKEGELLTVLAPSGTALDSITFIGTGKETSEEISAFDAMNIGGKVFAELVSIKAKEAVLVIDACANDDEVAANAAYGALLRSYRFDHYRTTLKKEELPNLKSLAVQSSDKKEADKLFKSLQKVADGVFLARDVVSEPPNKLYPISYADRIKKEFSKDKNVKVSVLDVKQMTKLGMGALLGVGQGSVNDSRLVVMEYTGLPKSSKAKPVALVGKGVTFDTGGISLKPSGGMEDMKYDMGGSGAVVGAMKAISGRKAKANVIGVVGLVENMPDGNAQRPSDVVTSMSGQTIEVLNTDAEGRLVLADALWYTQEKYKPSTVINLATLTGAIVIALGDQYAGLFSNDDALSEQIAAAGEETRERFWRFPLRKEYDKLLDSPIADMQNISSGRGAGSITAGQFLQRFIQDGVKWAHLDIAGVAWNKKGSDITPKGAEGFGVRALDRWVADNCEK